MKDPPEIVVHSGTFWVKLYFRVCSAARYFFTDISIWGEGADRDTVFRP